MTFRYVNIDKLPELESETTSRGRIYKTPEGKRYPSITTVLSAVKSDSINEWKDRIGHENADRIAKKAADRGTKVHKMCEDYLNNLEVDYKELNLRESYDMFKTIQKTIDTNIDNIWYQEQTLYSDTLKIAGRVDVIAEWNGKLSVIDFKTSSKSKRKDWITNYFTQESFYALALEEMIGQPIDQIVTLVAVEDGDPQIFIEKTENYIEFLVDARKAYSEKYKN